jgi:hypothetical protein
MCGFDNNRLASPAERAETAAVQLARLAERALDLPEGRIDFAAMRDLVQKRWATVSTLAHEIHSGVK